MGYIAPSLWTVNEYGQGLRNLIEDTRQLERWLDFRSYQVFEEATTYTALQFYTKGPNDAVKVAFSPAGPPPERPWADPDCTLPYEKLAFGERWLLQTGKERALIDKLYAGCSQLDAAGNTNHIFVGLQTSADNVYHLKKLGPGRYVCSPPKGERAPPPYEVELEDALMKPLVSGSGAKRYVEPKPETYLLFPYNVDDDGAHLIAKVSFEQDYPKAWKYLCSYEQVLRRREAELTLNGEFKRDEAGEIAKAPFNDDGWYRFGRHQSLDRQEIEKLIVPRLVTTIFCSVDHAGSIYLDNVDVGGVAPTAGMSACATSSASSSTLTTPPYANSSSHCRSSFQKPKAQLPPKKPL